MSNPPGRKRGLSFELSKLKMGASRAEREVSKQPGAVDFDSPPPTPKSIRPPLTPQIDHELRLACAYVLGNLRTSEQIYKEQYGRRNSTRQQSSGFQPYHALRGNASRLTGPSERSRSISTSDRPPEFSAQLASAAIVRKPSVVNHTNPRSPNLQQGTGLQLASPQIRTITQSRALFESFNLEPFSFERLANAGIERIEATKDDEAIGVDLSNFEPPNVNQMFPASVDHQLVHDVLEPANHARPWQAPKRHAKADSLQDFAETGGSSPRTQGTFEHSRNVSTAPTSVAITPARGSQRISAQPALPNLDKFKISDLDWMRTDSEKLPGAMEGAAPQHLEHQSFSTLGLGISTNSPAEGTLPTARFPVRKDSLHQKAGSARTRPLTPSSDTHPEEGLRQEPRAVPPVPQLDSRQSRDLARTESRRRRSTPRSESRQELDLRSASRQSNRSGRTTEEAFAEQLKTSLDLNNHNRATAAGRASIRTDGSRASSRSRRMFQINGPPHDGSGTPAASLYNSRPGSRARSIDRVREVVAAVVSPGSKQQSIRSFRTQDENESFEVHRSRSRTSKRHSRDFSWEAGQSYDNSQVSKPPVDLNRDLPPLPSLDQWTYTELEKPQHISTLLMPRSPHARTSLDAGLSEVHHIARDLDVPVRNDNASATTSRIGSIYSRYSKFPDLDLDEELSSYPALPIDADLPHPDIHERLGASESMHPVADPADLPNALRIGIPHQRIPSEFMFHANFGSEISIPQATQTDERPQMAGQKTQDMFLPDLDARARVASTANAGAIPTSNTAATAPRAPPTLKSSRSFRKVPNLLRRKNTAPTKSNTAFANAIERPTHTRMASEQMNFSRKPSVGNYSRLYDMGYRNIMEVPSQPRNEGESKQQGLMRSESKRWWKRATSRRDKIRRQGAVGEEGFSNVNGFDKGGVAHA